MADNTQTTAPQAPKKRPLLLKILNFIFAPVIWLAKKLFKKSTNITLALAEIPTQIVLHGAGVMALFAFIYNPLFMMFPESAWADSSSLFAYVSSKVALLDADASFSTNVSQLTASFGWGFLALVAVAIGGLAYVTNAARESFSVFGALVFVAILIGGTMAFNSYFPSLQILTGVLLHWVVMVCASLFFGLGMCTSKLNKRLKGVIDNNDVEE